MDTKQRPSIEANKNERIERGLHPKLGQQSLAETRRALMTYSKAELVDFLIREESNALKAGDRALQAEQELLEHRAESLTISKRPDHDPKDTPAQKRVRAEWMHRHHGQNLLADAIFSAGWNSAVVTSITDGGLVDTERRETLARLLDAGGLDDPDLQEQTITKLETYLDVQIAAANAPMVYERSPEA